MKYSTLVVCSNNSKWDRKEKASVEVLIYHNDLYSHSFFWNANDRRYFLKEKVFFCDLGGGRDFVDQRHWLHVIVVAQTLRYVKDCPCTILPRRKKIRFGPMHFLGYLSPNLSFAVNQESWFRTVSNNYHFYYKVLSSCKSISSGTYWAAQLSGRPRGAMMSIVQCPWPIINLQYI